MATDRNLEKISRDIQQLKVLSSGQSNREKRALNCFKKLTPNQKKAASKMLLIMEKYDYDETNWKNFFKTLQKHPEDRRLFYEYNNIAFLGADGDHE